MHKKITRRSFLIGTFGLLAACSTPGGQRQEEQIPYLPRRKRLPNPYLENGKPLVIIVHGTEFAPMLSRGMEALGGFARFGNDKSVHLKPNFVSPSRYPVTTDGSSLLTTVDFLKKDGFKDISIAECGSLTGPLGKLSKTRAFKYYGLDQKAVKGGFKIKDLYDDEVVRVKDNRWVAMPNVGIFKSVYQTALIINMPTIKQHSLLQFSCALKNTMGQIDRKTRLNMHRIGLAYTFSSDNRLHMSHLAAAEIAAAIDSDLTIIDARYGLGKSHHFRSGGISIKPDRIIISGDTLAADRVAAGILAEHYDGFQLEMAQPHLDHAASLGLGVASLDDVIIKEVKI